MESIQNVLGPRRQVPQRLDACVAMRANTLSAALTGLIPVYQKTRHARRVHPWVQRLNPDA
eukprot:6183971-Pleurochrysis_carterae.AAC.1